MRAIVVVFVALACACSTVNGSVPADPSSSPAWTAEPHVVFQARPGTPSGAKGCRDEREVEGLQQVATSMLAEPQCASDGSWRSALRTSLIGWMPLSLGAGGAGQSGGGLMRTTDGGRTWDCRNTPANAGPVSAADPQNAWATSVDRVGAIDRLYATSDGGASWTEIELTGVR